MITQSKLQKNKQSGGSKEEPQDVFKEKLMPQKTSFIF